MFDRNAPSSQRAIEEFRKEEVRASLYRYAAKRTQSLADAEDVLADALIRVLDPDDKPWDPAQRSFERHMRFLVRDVAIDRARSGYARFEVVDTSPGEAAASPDPQADEIVAQEVDVAWQRRMGTLLLTRLDGRDDLAARVYRLACQGVETPADMARELGCPIEEIYEAMRRIRYHGACVKAEDAEARAAGMKAARERATKGVYK